MKTCFSLICLLLSFGFLASGQEPGDVIWEFQTGDSLSSPAIGVDGTVYVGSVDKVYALNGKTGAKLWEFNKGASLFSTPTIGADGTVYVGSFDNKVYALDGKTGAKLWEFNTGVDEWYWSGLQHSPAIGSDGTVYIGSGHGKVYALNGKSGAKKWESSTMQVRVTSPAIGADGTIYVGASSDMTRRPLWVYALNGKSGVKKWEFTAEGNVTSPAIGADGTVYVGSANSGPEWVYALNGKTGAKKWEFKPGKATYASPVIGSDGTVYIGSSDEKLYALDGKTGAKKWEFQTGDEVISAPAIGSDGTLYIESFNKLFALKTSSSGPADSAWPMVGQNAQRTGRKMASPARVPPVITTHPISQTVDAGASVTFSVAATGTQPLSYRWRRNGVFLGPATESPTFTLGNVQPEQGGTYRVVVSNAAGTVTSGAAELVVKETLHTLTVASRDPDSGMMVTISPADQNGQSDGTTQFTRVYAKGTEVMLSAKQTVGVNQFKQWLGNGVSIGTEPTVTVTMDYDRTLRAVYEVGIQSPVITTHPISQTVDAGASVTFSVEATGIQAISYRWRRNGVFLGSATESPTLTLRNAQPEQAGTYRVVVSNAAGEVMSQAAELIVAESNPPTITKFPTDVSVGLNRRLELKIKAVGTAPLRYQWYKDGKPIPDTVSSALVIDSAKLSDAGVYSVMVINNYGATVSNEVKVSIIQPRFLLESRINEKGNLVLNAVGPNNASVTFQYSDNLKTWTDHFTLPLNEGSTTLSFPVPSNEEGQLFYRLKLVE